MATIRVKKTHDYTVMSNRHFKEREMSLKAKGLLSLMLSLPDDWVYSVEGLTKLNSDGKDSIKSALTELEKFGYVRRTIARDKRGVICGMNYEIREKPLTEKPLTEKPLTEKPLTEKPLTEKPLTEKPLTEKPTLLNTNKLNTNKSSTNEINNVCITICEKIAHTYNNICISLRPLKRMTDKRKDAVENILSVYTFEELEDIFRKAEASDYCKGSREGWKASFDWLMNEDNIAKLLEGNYDNYKKQTYRRKEIVPSWLNKEKQTYDFDSIEKNLTGSSEQKPENSEEFNQRVEELKKQLAAL